MDAGQQVDLGAFRAPAAAAGKILQYTVYSVQCGLGCLEKLWHSVDVELINIS